MLINEHDFKDLADGIAQAIDLAGLAIIVVGLAFATLGFVSRLRDEDVYRLFRRRVGKAILLGLEFLVAADIIRTIAVAPTFRGVGVLAVIVAVRTFLSFTLEVELEGRWPWRGAPTGPRHATPSPGSGA